jgi:GNAT superfamily N-acetyltransferase
LNLEIQSSTFIVQSLNLSAQRTGRPTALRPRLHSMSTSPIIRMLSEDDLDFADRVRLQAGWNQTRADWRRLIELEPSGCFVAELDGVLAGTATTTVYGGDDLAWIGMVLVDEAARRRGVGTALLEHCISHLKNERRVRCIKLDATSAGQPLYEKLGFVAEWGLQRWQATMSGNSTDARTAVDDLTDAAFALDRVTFGADRSALLRSLATGCISVKCEGSAFGIVRPGSRASYLGPVVAESWEQARPLVEHLLAAAPAGEIFWDIPVRQSEAMVFAEERGFSIQRQVVRMALDGVALEENAKSVFGIAEPALG